MSGHKGLYSKYRVLRADTGEEVDGFFLLRPVTDDAARIAVATYAYATHNPRLRIDLLKWLADIRMEQAKKELDRMDLEAELNPEPVEIEQTLIALNTPAKFDEGAIVPSYERDKLREAKTVGEVLKILGRIETPPGPPDLPDSAYERKQHG